MRLTFRNIFPYFKCSFAILMVCLTFSCGKDTFCNCLQNSGSIITEKRDLAPFNRLYINKNIETLLMQDTAYFVKITAGKNLTDGISADVDEGKLTITNNNHCNWGRSYKNKFIAEVHFKDLQYINYAATGNVTTLNRLKLDSLFFESFLGSGSAVLDLDARSLLVALQTSVADITLKGTVHTAVLFANAQGFIDASRLTNSYTEMRTNSTNDCKVRVSDHLDAIVQYIGNIYYYGNPKEVTFKTTGTGKLIKAD